MLNVLLKNTFYKINLYFYANKIYFKCIDIIWWKGNNTFSITTKIYLYLSKIFINNEENDNSLTIIYLKNKIKLNYNLRKLLNTIYHYCSQNHGFGRFEECVYYYLPYIFVFCVLLYDLKNNEINKNLKKFLKNKFNIIKYFI